MTKRKTLPTWKELKQRGTAHYKTKGVELIDLYRAATPSNKLTALQIKGLTDIMKYAYRMLVNGVNESDCEKIKHWIDMVLFNHLEQEPAKEETQI